MSDSGPREDYHTVTPYLVVPEVARLIEFLTRAFGAVERMRLPRGDGSVMHAEVMIGDSVVMIGDPDQKLYGDPRTLGRCSASLHIFVDDNAALLRRAVEAGAQQIQPPTDLFYGANSASLRDPFGHVWVLLSWKEDLDPAEIVRRGSAFLHS